jgi:gas vesicle protein
MKRIPVELIGLACMVVGGLVGASVALLMAPQSGASHAQLLSKGMEIKEKLADELTTGVAVRPQSSAWFHVQARRKNSHGCRKPSSSKAGLIER